MTDNEPDIEDRGSNIRLTVEKIINASNELLFERFDMLKKRGINDEDLVEALRYLEHEELLEAYAEWAAIDIREDDNTTLNPVVPDPGDAPSYTAMNLTNIDGTRFHAERGTSGNWHVYKKRNAQDNGAFIGTYPTREAAAGALAVLEAGEA
jgi:hypothetical protein